MNQDQNQTPPRPPQSQIGLGGDAQVQNLSGIAPAVVDAFLNANAKKPVTPLHGGAVTAPDPISPRSPDSLGDFPAVDAAAVKQRKAKIRHLAMMVAAGDPGDEPGPGATATASPPGPPPPSP